jgi:hypothetical protein
VIAALDRRTRRGVSASPDVRDRRRPGRRGEIRARGELELIPEGEENLLGPRWPSG